MISLGVAPLENNLDQDTPRAETAGGTQQTFDARIAEPRESSVPVVRLGQRAGRFVLLSEIGRGGMGTVYSAYDAHLERKVAIKLLHRNATAGPSSHRRLLHEAQAMARVSHPNVVSVYEVGEIESQVFIAMEFIDGSPLSVWQKQPDRTWAEVLAMYLQAGRGLAAAHGMGLIHRDFKPDNVLVGRDGRARVLDFGLARFDELQPEEPSPANAGTTKQPWTRTDTGTGMCAGTPGYMSPEQYLGAPLDARSDQFSFCVALYEGLYGNRPFSGKTVPELTANTVDGKLLPPPADTHVPEELRRILERGLMPSPTERFATLEALLHVLHLETTDTWGAVGLSRRRFANTMLGVVLLLTAGMQTLRALRPIRIRDMLITSAVMLSVLLGVGFMRRRALLRNALHRRVWTLMAIAMVQNLGLRLIGIYQSLPYAQLAPFELLVMGGAVAMVSLYLGWAMLWVAGLLLVVACTWTYFGEASTPYLSWAYPVALVSTLWAWNRASIQRA